MGGMEIPSSWERLRLSAMEGVILIVGATDTGKTTFARYLYRRLSAHHERMAFVDGDVGQATLGPPTTMTMALARPNDAAFPPAGERFRIFVGDISPVDHMLPMVVGAHRLVQQARRSGATAIVFDTTGLVSATHGGQALKLALVDLLRPQLVIGFQRGIELEHLLVPLRRSRRTRVIDRKVAEAVERRGAKTRRGHRTAQYRRCFERARLLEVRWTDQAVIPAPAFSKHRLVAFEDEQGFVLQLGIVKGYELGSDTVLVYTPLSSMEDVDTIHVGDVAVDLETFQDERV